MLARQASIAVILGGTLLAACADAPRSRSGAGGRVDGIETPSKEAAAAGASSGEADRFLGKQREETFERLRREIESVQVISTLGLARLGLRWDDGSAFADARARFVSAKTAEDAYYAVRALQRAPHDAHSRLELDSSPASSTALREPNGVVALPLELAVEYEADGPRYVVASGGPNAGARVVAVDGKPIAAVERELLTWVVGSSAEKWRASVAGWLTRRSAADLPVPRSGARTTLDLVRLDGTSARVDLAWEKAAREAAPSADKCTDAVPSNPDYASRVPEHVGENLCVYPGGDAGTKIVRWFSFSYEEEAGFRREYETLFERLGDAKATRLLFDVRENGGGVFDPTVVSAFTTAAVTQLAMEVVFTPGLKKNPSLLDDAEGVAQAARAKEFLLANPSAQKSPRFPFICSEDCDPSEMTLPRPSSPMVAETVVLTGPDCVSACDNFAAMMKDSGVARIAGMPPAAGDSPVRVRLPLALADGTTFGIVLTVAVNRRPNGAVLEGAPDIPSVPVFPSAANRGRYLEAVLDAVGF